MNDALRLAMVVGAIVFALVLLVPIASFLLRAVVIAGLAALAVYVFLRVIGR